MNFAGKTVLVVGGSGVLGAGLVSELASRGATVFATCQNQDSAERIPSAANLKLVLDLANPQSIDGVAQYLQANYKIDGVLVASGLVGFGGSQKTTAAQTQHITQVNYLGVTQVLTALIPQVSTGSEPFIGAITGVVAEKVFPGMAAYSASKTALSVWLTSVRMELRRSGVRVIDARPGHTETGLATRASFGTAPAMPTGMMPEHVVNVILDGIANGEDVLESSKFEKAGL